MKKLILLLLMVLCVVGMTNAQRTITGSVVDTDGESLIGANVLAAGTTVGTITDIDGSFTLEVPDDTNTLSISYTGFNTLEVPLGSDNTISIVLTEGIAIDEVVVTALNIKRDEKSLGYAVTKLGGDEIADTKETNIINSLQGKIAGVQIAGSPSTLGGSSRITIRGANSFLGNNQPLFVVDGIPIDNGNLSTASTESSQARGFGGALAYDYGNAAQDINPEDIESMVVLKGAAATALYGQRGANGVIQITTKGGRDRKGIGIEFNTQMNFDEVRNLIPHQRQYGGGDIASTSSGFYEVIQDGVTYLTPAYAKDGAWGPKYDPNSQVRHWDSWDAEDPSTYKETRPWIAPANDYETFFETGATRTSSIAFTGGNDSGGFRAGFTNLDGKGVIPGGKLQRNTLTLKSDYSLSDRVTVNVNGSYIRNKGENRNITGYNNGNPLQGFTQWWQTQLDLDRLQNAYNVDGSQKTWNPVGAIVDEDRNLLYFDSTPNFFDNPYWVRENYLQEDVRNRLLGGGGLNIDIGSGFSVSGTIGTDWYQTSNIAGIPTESVELSVYQEDEIRFQETNMEARLNYAGSFDRLTINGFVGANRMRQNRRTSSATTNGGLSLDGFYNISNSVSPATFSTDERGRGINSVLGAVSFGFDNWFYVDVTARNDWSSTLPEGSNSYFYPAVTLTSVLSELPGFSNSGFISFLKLRASYAQAGNDADPYRLTDVFDPEIPNFGASPRYSVPNSQNNPVLKPERTSEVEFGIDLRILNNRIGVDLAYFNRNTKDQIFSVPSSAATGYTSRILNSGEMRNSGFELQLNVIPVQARNFRWTVGFNVAKLENEVVDLAEGVESIDMGGTWAADLRIQKGEKYMALYGQDYVYDGNGNRMVDENGAYMFTSDRVYLGSALADWAGGLNTEVNFFGISVGGALDFQYGGIMHSTSLQWSKYSGMHPETVEYNGQTDIRENGMVLDGVQEDGSTNTVSIDPQTYYQTYWRNAAPNVYSTDFIKLRDLRIGYTIPNRLLSGVGIRDLRVSVTGRNIAILSSDVPFIDPQIVTSSGNRQGLENAQVPPTRSYGVNVSFKL